ncbi:MAG: tRNA (adenosine(37)-N6)-threonylcarbamoyltransferase complex dimerization subunit type 1 TsaB [Ferruginibacter sp.]|nr:tRNA (adenosine(37)-N6)-threonylcarbamoyltransferase complex dimerization subunit type 1 TsaB [Ferruginibacter sp.]
MILLIDTTTETALVALANEGKIIAQKNNSQQKNHAAFIHPAIQELLNQNNIQINQLRGVLVTEGPGSYTGIRVGLASAKGICLALNLPLMMVNRLYAMALASKQAHPLDIGFYIPMIDARRLEVFYAVFNASLTEITPPSHLILSENSFSNLLENNPVVFTGSGCEKFYQISNHKNIIRLPELNLANELALISKQMMAQEKWTNIVDAQPFYSKDFYNG